MVQELADTMAGTSICGLGQVAANPITSVIKYFRDDLEKYLALADKPPIAGR
jgi:NADH:ubiquinone oxidoreductase subunit F (NADH-binding)